MQRHGGLDGWLAMGTLSVKLRFGGLAFLSKWCGASHVVDRATIWTTEPRVEFAGFPMKAHRGIFTATEVWIEDDAHRRVASRMNPREAFRSLRHTLWWDKLDFLYFCGYALWNYLNAPFILTYEGVESHEGDRFVGNNEVWYRVHATFHPSVPTHCPSQTFYFDRDLKLRRHDYEPHVFASFARAAQVCSNHQKISGCLFPMRRQVFPRDQSGQVGSWPTLVWIEIEDIQIPLISQVVGLVPGTELGGM